MLDRSRFWFISEPEKNIYTYLVVWPEVLTCNTGFRRKTAGELLYREKKEVVDNDHYLTLRECQKSLLYSRDYHG